MPGPKVDWTKEDVDAMRLAIDGWALRQRTGQFDKRGRWFAHACNAAWKAARRAELHTDNKLFEVIESEARMFLAMWEERRLARLADIERYAAMPGTERLAETLRATMYRVDDQLEFRRRHLHKLATRTLPPAITEYTPLVTPPAKEPNSTRKSKLLRNS